MKSAALAAAAVAAVASAHEARAPLDFGLSVPGVLDFQLCLGLDIKLPAGISIESDGCPSGPPSNDCTNVWHPPHHVPMDGCDDNGNHDWHYVHPCDCKASDLHTWGTSTVTQTQVSTIISCAPTVTNCPAGGSTVTTVIVPATTFICPVPVTSTTLATVPATSTKPASHPGTWTQPPATSQAPPPPPNTWTQPATQSAAVPATTPVTQAPPPPASTPVVVTPPATIPGPESSTVPVVVVPPPVGTGSPPAGNWTQPPPAMAGASQTSQRVGAVVAMGLAAALLI